MNHIKMRKQIFQTVFPSDQYTIQVEEDEDYGGAHLYEMTNSIGFNKGKTEYVNSFQTIQFIQKNEDGSIVEGLLSEQLLIVLIDRHKKLNNRYPSREGALAITKMEQALQWLEARIKERIVRDVMGELKK
jgi:hypothetical protein